MNNLEIKCEWKKVNVSAKFNHPVNILTGDSATGKTLLLQAIQYYCLQNNVSCYTMDVTHREIPENVKVLLMDNADVYVQPGMIELLTQKDVFVVMILHNIPYYRCYDKVGQYVCRFVDNTLEVLQP